jgi:hypothetical protein
MDGLNPSLLDHPVSEIFPMMADADLRALADDIAAHGVRSAIWMYEGRILDGRNRYRASKMAGKACPSQEYMGADPIGFVLSLNLSRRHLTESQRAMVAATVANMRQGERTDLASIDARLSQPEAAAALKVSRSAVQRATKVRQKAVPEVVRAVETGSVSVSQAATIADLPQVEQPAALERAIEQPRAPRVPKAAPVVAPDTAEFQATIDDLRQRNAELAKTCEELLAENEALSKVIDAEDRIVEALAQAKAAREREAVLQSRLDGMMHERNANIKHIKALQRQLGERK